MEKRIAELALGGGMAIIAVILLPFAPVAAAALILGAIRILSQRHDSTSTTVQEAIEKLRRLLNGEK